jgi:outer membrane protein insertion porin family
LLRRWFLLPNGHVLRLGGFVGVITGRAPFFYKFYPADLTELIPARMLGLNLDRRPPPNIFQTSIGEMRQQNLAARIDTEYAVPLFRGEEGIYNIDAYFGAGLFGLAEAQDLRAGIPGYDGLSKWPIGLTFDLGATMDTNIGVFRIGLSTLFGFVR